MSSESSIFGTRYSRLKTSRLKTLNPRHETLDPRHLNWAGPVTVFRFRVNIKDINLKTRGQNWRSAAYTEGEKNATESAGLITILL